MPNITSLTYNRENITLICTSTGGPATTVTWMNGNKILRIDGSTYRQEQRILDRTHATYENILYSDDAANFVGVLTCIVKNARGESEMSRSTSGMLITMIIIL